MTVCRLMYENVRRQRAGRRDGHVQRLTEDALRRGHEPFGQEVRRLRQDDHVRRKRHATLADPDAKLDGAGDPRVGVERRERHLPRLLRDEPELATTDCPAASVSNVTVGSLRRFAPGIGLLVQRDAEQVGRRLRGVRHRREQIELLAAVHRARLRQRDRERRVAHEHGPLRLANQTEPGRTAGLRAPRRW